MSEEVVEGSAVVWEVFDPAAEYEAVIYRPAPRLKDLNNKKVGLFWNGKPSGNVVLDSIGGLLQDRYEGIELKLFNAGFPAAPEMIKQMAAESDAVIGATGD
jgi:hypothetical protein